MKAAMIFAATIAGLIMTTESSVGQRSSSDTTPFPPTAKVTFTPSGRITAPPVEQMNDAQKKEYDMSIKGFGGPLGPRMPLLNSPEVLQAWQGMQDALAKSALSNKVRELAILTVASEWKSEFEWYVHAKMAQRAGIDAAVIEAIRVGKQPTFASEDDKIVYNYAHELVSRHRVSDASYNAAWKLLGTRSLVDLTVLLGHYGSVSMMLNAHEMPLPDGIKKAF